MFRYATVMCIIDRGILTKARYACRGYSSKRVTASVGAAPVQVRLSSDRPDESQLHGGEVPLEDYRVLTIGCRPEHRSGPMDDSVRERDGVRELTVL